VIVRYRHSALEIALSMTEANSRHPTRRPWL
jgi:hypothetical protein